MTTLLLILMALLLIAALERTHRRQPPHPPGIHGAHDDADRDWARTKLELLARGAESDRGAETDQGRHVPQEASNRPHGQRLEVHRPRPLG